MLGFVVSFTGPGRAGHGAVRQCTGRRSARAGSKRTVISCVEANAQKKAAAPTEGVNDLYQPFLDYAIKTLKERLPDLDGYPIPEGFEEKEAVTGKGSRAQSVRTRSFAYKTGKLRQIRAAHVQGGKALQVLNFVIFPELKYRLPFFGADLVTLPGGHLIALDMQPLFSQSEDYLKEFYESLKPTYEKFAKDLPWGGDFPEEAKPFFSPCFLWTRPSEDGKVQNEVFDAFKEYLDMYLKHVENVKEVSDPEALKKIEERHIAYLKYRAEKDPARGMFQRFYGPDWTEKYIHGFLFDLEEKMEDGSYVSPLKALA
eukprot:Plantae.Rhodophyta-Purpureofilum_apyrenoidigerum.ctg12432.p1 GENE.Plantae.Rhodophyta-Purpureofilum_apyrenoidigerum.ctg12432~~Plantae.Rhodophyta-Purpureofilum_apyrenoidigerum.ctg12432.p1  ORF type:complete len:314 (+),score=64.89 Plantae.Rhodophyta-Purpureofilum_apyrenoidigerum.ctg12432:117-1058(+)